MAEARPAAGPYRIPTRELLDDLIAGYVVLGEWPTWRDYIAFGSYSGTTLVNRFGSWSAAKAAAREHLADCGGVDGWLEGGGRA